MYIRRTYQFLLVVILWDYMQLWKGTRNYNFFGILIYGLFVS